MTHRWALVAVLAAALLAPAAVPAHEGHAHKVMGTVSSIDGDHVMVKTADGKSVMVMLNAKTKITQGKTSLDKTALKVGTRVVAEGTDNKGTITATSVQVGVTTTTTAAATK
ncbi:MAG: hypothetical protein HY657_20335 [Acidobacteria bacterium]|nr:hypothetical protein [Acidobacteriota bacterium]